MSSFYLLLSLFAGCFLAATVIPFSSELMFIAAIKSSDIQVSLLILIATLGNTLGGLTGYWLGKLGKWTWLEKYFRISKSKAEDLRNYSDRYGYWLALACWLPFIGDLLCVILGFFRAKFWPITILMFIGKLARYAVIAIILQ